MYTVRLQMTWHALIPYSTCTGCITASDSFSCRSCWWTCRCWHLQIWFKALAAWHCVYKMVCCMSCPKAGQRPCCMRFHWSIANVHMQIEFAAHDYACSFQLMIDRFIDWCLVKLWDLAQVHDDQTICAIIYAGQSHCFVIICKLSSTWFHLVI